MEELAPMSVGERITGDTSWLLLAPEAWPEDSPVFLVMVVSRGRWRKMGHVPPAPHNLVLAEIPTSS